MRFRNLCNPFIRVVDPWDFNYKNEYRIPKQQELTSTPILDAFKPPPLTIQFLKNKIIRNIQIIIFAKTAITIGNWPN